MLPKKIDKFNKYNKAYYDLDSPIVSDQEYDSLKAEIISFEKKYKLLKSKFSPSISVGYKLSNKFKKIKHKVPMLSLSNAFSEKDIVDFIKKIRKLP